MMEISDWKLSGGGVQGCNYFSESNPDIVLKLYSPHFNREYVEHEFENIRAFLRCGFCCPDAYEVLKYNGSYGLVLQRIKNKISFCKLFSAHPEMESVLVKRLAAMAKQIHFTSSEGTPFRRFLDMLQSLLDNNELISGKMRVKFQKTIDELRLNDSKTILHGDFHFGNVITDGIKDYFIDLGSLSAGNPIFDLSMFYLVTHFGTEQMCEDTFHLSTEDALNFWDMFKVEYYGEDIPDDVLFREYRKYLFLKTLWIQADTDFSALSWTLMDMFSDEKCPSCCFDVKF